MNALRIKHIVSGIFALVILSVSTLPFSTMALNSLQASGVLPTPTPMALAPKTILPLTEIALVYLADKYSVLPEHLAVTDQYQQDYAYLEKSYWLVIALDTKRDAVYKVLVDVADESVSEDIASIEQADREAKRARYGKLEPALYERLQTIQPNELVEVAIWVAGETEHSQQDLFTLLAAKYPDVQKALKKSGNPLRGWGL